MGCAGIGDRYRPVDTDHISAADSRASIEDRIVALDLLSANAIAFIAVYSIQKNTTTFLDAGIILALLAFLSTVAFAFYLGRREKQ